MAVAWANRAAAAVDLYAGEAAASGRAGARRRRLPLTRSGAPVEAALSRTLAGRALAEAGERERAVTELQRAAREFEACGALRYRDEAERELRKLGHRIHRRTRPGKTDGTGIESLTERELQVARLVVDRKTNPEIAAELFLSQKTVETHLRNIFRKARRLVTSRPGARSRRACRPRRQRDVIGDRPQAQFPAALSVFGRSRSQPWNGERSPASHASRSPGVLRSQSGRISRVTARRSCHRSSTDGRPQNQ